MRNCKRGAVCSQKGLQTLNARFQTSIHQKISVLEFSDPSLFLRISAHIISIYQKVP